MGRQSTTIDTISITINFDININITSIIKRQI